MKEQISTMKNGLDTEGQWIRPGLSNDLQKLFSGSDDSKFQPFMKLPWQEQQKYLNSSSSTGIRYHPLIVNLTKTFKTFTYKNLLCDSTIGYV